MARPPRLTAWIAARRLGRDAVGRSILGDLTEEHAQRARSHPRAARRWYRREAWSVMWRTPVRRQGDPMIRLLWTDLRGAARSLRKQPRFTLVAALTVALGVGAVTATFSVVNGVLLRPLPYPDEDRLVNLWSTAPGLGYDQFPLSPDLFFFFREHSTAFESAALFQTRQVNLTETGTPDIARAAVATHSYFTTLGVPIARGRDLGPTDDQPDAPLAVVLAHRFWQQRLGGEPSALSRTIRIDGEPATVVGIAPEWIDTAGSPELFLPTRFTADTAPVGTFSWNAAARLRPGVSPEAAVAQLEPLVVRAMEEMVGTSPNYRAFLTDGRYRPLVNSMRADLVGDVARPLWILLGTVGMVLLIACANVANLFLIRAEGRQRDLAVRAALGAGRAALVRAALVEALVLSALGSALGVVVAAAALPAVLRLAPASIPRLDQVTLDLNVVAFAAAAAALAALAFGLVPALRYSRQRALGSLRHGGRGGTDDPSRRRMRHGLVVVQTAMALVLLVGSGLLARSFGRLLATDLGFETSNVMTFRVSLPRSDYGGAAEILAFNQQLVDRLRRLPGAEAAGATTSLPVASSASGSAYEFEGQPLAPGQLPPMVFFSTVTPGFFDTMNIPILAGRDFTSGDTRDGARVIVVNQHLADQYWPGENPIGKRLRPSSSSGPQPAWMEVVGVVGSVRDEGPRQPARPLIYFGLNETGPNGQPRAMSFAVRAQPGSIRADALRQTVWALDADLPVASVTTMDEVVEGTRAEFTFTMLTLGIAAGLALVLGAIGLYGVLAYAVTLRTREIGVRLALGAEPRRVMRSVVMNGVLIATGGLVLGLAGALGLSSFLGSLLYETEPIDPMTYAGMSAAFLAVALLASYLPARRAAAVSPLESMRID